MTGSKKRQIVLACDAFLRPNELISYWKKGLGQKKSVRLVKTCLFFRETRSSYDFVFRVTSVGAKNKNFVFRFN